MVFLSKNGWKNSPQVRDIYYRGTKELQSSDLTKYTLSIKSIGPVGLNMVVEKLRIMSKNVHFHYIKPTILDITTFIFKIYDSRKTNNTSFECPSRWVQNTRRTDLQLFQGLSRNLSLKKCIFYQKSCVTVPDRATKLSLRYFEPNIKG